MFEWFHCPEWVGGGFAIRAGFPSPTWRQTSRKKRDEFISYPPPLPPIDLRLAGGFDTSCGLKAPEESLGRRGGIPSLGLPASCFWSDLFC